MCPWMMANKSAPFGSCALLEDYFVSSLCALKTKKQMMIMSENWLPGGQVCDDQFMTSIIIHEPFQHVQSHYNHLYQECLKVNIC